MQEQKEEEKNRCIVCNSSEILELNCKIQCLNCGFKRDCSDP